jgi:hypothetical protein
MSQSGHPLANARTKDASQAKYISILNIIQGEVDPTEVMIIISKH